MKRFGFYERILWKIAWKCLNALPTSRVRTFMYEYENHLWRRENIQSCFAHEQAKKDVEDFLSKKNTNFMNDLSKKDLRVPVPLGNSGLVPPPLDDREFWGEEELKKRREKGLSR